MFKIFKYLNKKEWLFVILGVTFVAFAVWLDLRIPDHMADITELVFTEGSTISEIWREGLWMLATAFASMAAMIIVGYAAGRLSAGLARDLIAKIFGKVLDFSQAEVNRFSVASLITRATNDVTQVQNILVMGFQTLIRSPIMAVWATIMIFNRGLEWSVATFIAVAIMLCVILILIIFALPKFKIIQELTDRLNLVTREHLTGIRVVKAYHAKNYEEEKFADANIQLMKTNRFVRRMMTLLLPVVGFVMNALPLAIYLIGAYLLNEVGIIESLDIFSNMVVFAQYGMMVIMAFLMISIMFVMLPQAMVSAHRINEVLEKAPSLKYPETKSDATIDTKVAVAFNKVNFKYPEAEDYVLEDINFTVGVGETVAFIGATGSGKSTILKLIARAYDVTDGTVHIAGKDVKAYTETELTDKIGYILQKATLFSGSIASNVAFANEDVSKNMPDIKDATDLAQASEFIDKMENTYEANITQGGSNLSGGQRQRLSIARALFRKPDILMFDDSFSALDYKTDRNLREALKKECSDVTKLIVAQRVSTIKDANKIIVLDEGSIVGVGTHRQLLKNCSVYHEIASSQLTEEELVNG